MSAGVAAAAAAGDRSVRAADPAPNTPRAHSVGTGFRYSLNTATIRGQKLSLPEQIDVAAAAGYEGIEPWVGDLKEHAEKGGRLEDVAKQIRDRGLAVPSAIAFFPWIVEDAGQRARGLEQAKREMELALRIGATRIAAPPAGTRDSDRINLLAAAERYRALVDLGVSLGIVPQLELWGFSKAFSRLGEAMLIAMDRDSLLVISGTGDVIQPTDGVAAIGSGGAYAQAAARALMVHSELTAAQIVRASLEIAADLCIYTNRNIEVDEL